MADAPKAAFDEFAAAFADYGTSVRGYVRYRITQRNLEPFIPRKPPLKILDVGGGGGADTAWLAERGHYVDYVEPSNEQRRYAERRFNFFLSDTVRERVRILDDELEAVHLSAAQYDVVLMHTVAVFQPEPQRFMKRVLKMVRPGGIVSILEKNYYGTELRAIHDRNFEDLSLLHRTGRSINNFRQNAYAFKPEEIERIITGSHFTVLEWSGVRVLTDDFTQPAEKVPAKQLKLLLDAEYRQGHNPSIRGHGQLSHFIARRNEA